MDLPLQANSCNINCQNLFVTKQSTIKNVIACDYQEMNANIAFCYLDAIIPLLDLNSSLRRCSRYVSFLVEVEKFLAANIFFEMHKFGNIGIKGLGNSKKKFTKK